ncbi:MAG: C-terminal binding protein [Bacteroidales bacterium]|nr:C-terminal binding protein [Bacteroidales bacterium]
MAEFIVYVTDYDYPDIEIERKILAEEANAELKELQTRDPKILKRVLKDADAIICQYAPMNSEVINELTKCKAIGRYGIGYDNIDVAACNKAGIIVVNVPSYCEEEVSDTAVAMSYALSRKLLFYNSNLKAGKWDWKPGVPIHRFNTLKVGLIGFGGIAKATTRKFKSLGLEVFVTDPYIPDEIFLKNGVKKVRLDTLLRECDIISVHVPLTESTRHLIGEKEFGMMKETAIIINTSRGPVIDEKALIDALQNGKIGGAGLDVFEKEPLSPDSPLLQMNNVIVTPHCGWYSEESKIDIRVKLAKDIARVLNGKEPFGFVNKKHIVR